MRYTVTHRTTYTYESEVSSSYGHAHLLPRDLPGQQVRSAQLDIRPRPGDVSERTDYFGNRTSYFSLAEPHTKLEVTATSVVDVAGRGVEGRLLVDPPWEEARDAVAASADVAPPDAEDLTPDLLAAIEFALSSSQAPRSAAAAAYAMPSFGPGRGLVEATLDLSSRIHRNFEFKPGATGVGTPVEEILARRKGVCQDFAHLTVSCLRSLGLPARYVSGYLETDPPPGRPKLQGADVSHAWPSVYVPGVGWVDVDPTNDQLVNDRYITTGWGRDYGDVAPLKGVIFTDSDRTTLQVSVDVRQTPSAPAPRAEPVGETGGWMTQQQQQQQGPRAQDVARSAAQPGWIAQLDL